MWNSEIGWIGLVDDAGQEVDEQERSTNAPPTHPPTHLPYIVRWDQPMHHPPTHHTLSGEINQCLTHPGPPHRVRCKSTNVSTTHKGGATNLKVEGGGIGR